MLRFTSAFLSREYNRSYEIVQQSPFLLTPLFCFKKKRIYLEDYKNFGIRYADRPRMIQLHEQVRSITHIGLLNTVEPATWNYNLTYV